MKTTPINKASIFLSSSFSLHFLRMLLLPWLSLSFQLRSSHQKSTQNWARFVELEDKSKVASGFDFPSQLAKRSWLMSFSCCASSSNTRLARGLNLAHDPVAGVALLHLLLSVSLCGTQHVTSSPPSSSSTWPLANTTAMPTASTTSCFISSVPAICEIDSHDWSQFEYKGRAAAQAGNGRLNFRVLVSFILVLDHLGFNSNFVLDFRFWFSVVISNSRSNFQFQISYN